MDAVPLRKPDYNTLIFIERTYIALEELGWTL
jgi:hypothetical protein